VREVTRLPYPHRLCRQRFWPRLGRPTTTTPCSRLVLWPHGLGAAAILGSVEK